ncbi:MAG: hypothetical protein OSJ72_07550 [Lachnospiraceae bacterium]|nr:hypothetical protein [Lachnospiraceae bacterium]
MRKTGRENAGESCSLMRILTEHITGLEKGMREKGRYILGIDQGGTKTAAVLMREDGVLLGKGKARGAYFPTQGMQAAEEEIVLTGNVFKGEALRRRVEMQIAARFPGAQVVSARYEPEVGACIMGLQHQGLEAAKREEAMRESAAALGVLRS